MCKCICVPKRSHSDKACPECFPERRKKARERVHQTFRQKRQRLAKSMNLGIHLLEFERFTPDPVGVPPENTA